MNGFGEAAPEAVLRGALVRAGERLVDQLEPERAVGQLHEARRARRARTRARGALVAGAGEWQLDQLLLRVRLVQLICQSENTGALVLLVHTRNSRTSARTRVLVRSATQGVLERARCRFHVILGVGKPLARQCTSAELPFAIATLEFGSSVHLGGTAREAR